MNELTQILTETAERLLADHAGKETVKAAADGQWPEALWATLEENGLTQPLVPEQQGGIGAGWEDAFVIALAAGRHRAPVPLPETIAAGWLLAAAGIPVPAGPIALADDLDAKWQHYFDSQSQSSIHTPTQNMFENRSIMTPTPSGAYLNSSGHQHWQPQSMSLRQKQNSASFGVNHSFPYQQFRPYYLVRSGLF